MNLIFYHFNCSERLLKPTTFSLTCNCCLQSITLKSVSKVFGNVEWSISLLRHFKIQKLLKINYCCMAAISALRVTQHSQIFHFSLQIEFNALHFINYTIPRLCSTYAVATISIQLCYLKMVKVSKLVQSKLIPYRSIIGLGAFQKIKYFQDSYCAYRDLTIKSKLFKNIFLLSCLFTI